MAATDLATRELERIEREAYKILRMKSAKPQKPKQIRVSKEVRSYARRVKKYRELSGRKRLTKEEKSALHFFTPGQVFRSQTKLTDRTYMNRIKKFETKYGEKFTKKFGSSYESRDLLTYTLQYLGVEQAARRFGIYEKPGKSTETQPESTETTVRDGWEKFTEIEFPDVSWEDLGSPPIRDKDWPHFSGDFLYENGNYLHAVDPNIDLNVLMSMGKWTCKDHTMLDFMSLVVPHIWGNILVDPTNAGILKENSWDGIFIVKKDEWDNAEELSEDFLTSRLYKPKRK